MPAGPTPQLHLLIESHPDETPAAHFARVLLTTLEKAEVVYLQAIARGLDDFIVSVLVCDPRLGPNEPLTRSARSLPGGEALLEAARGEGRAVVVVAAAGRAEARRRLARTYPGADLTRLARPATMGEGFVVVIQSHHGLYTFSRASPA
jgi:hypothetical protein